MYLLASYVFHIRVLEVKWSDESHIFTFNAGMYWIHKSPHAFRLVHWSALHQVCYHAKSTVTDLVVASRKYIFCLCIPEPASRESQNPGAFLSRYGLGIYFQTFWRQCLIPHLGLRLIMLVFWKRKGALHCQILVESMKFWIILWAGFLFRNAAVRPEPFQLHCIHNFFN